MKKNISKKGRRNKPAGPVPKILKWAVLIGVAALIVYGISQMSGVAYSETALPMVDFSSLTSSEKRTALQAANRARCTCGCGMALAQCVATDSTCPVREANIQTIRTMVQQADQP